MFVHPCYAVDISVAHPTVNEDLVSIKSSFNNPEKRFNVQCEYYGAQNVG